MVAEKSWLDAKEFYTKGLAVLNDKSDDKWEKPTDPDADAKLVLQLREQIYANRALANLELSRSRYALPRFDTDTTRELPLDYFGLCRGAEGEY